MVVTRTKALVKTKEIKDSYPNINNFRFSSSWLNGFLFHNDLSNRWHTTILQHLSEDLIEQQNQFLNLVLFKYRQYNYNIQHIGKWMKRPYHLTCLTL